MSPRNFLYLHQQQDHKHSCATLGVTFAYTAFRACLSLLEGVFPMTGVYRWGKLRQSEVTQWVCCQCVQQQETSLYLLSETCGEEVWGQWRLPETFHCNPGHSKTHLLRTKLWKNQWLSSSWLQCTCISYGTLSVSLQGLGFSWKERV